jgi:2',3'-cyclic-nucleotide 2'-phosphodiesterase (5'-nucleotidase family)
LKDSVDAVVAITHQSMDADELLAREVPGLAAIIGGHEHDHRYDRIGNVYITKAMANAKNAYVVNLHINKKKSRVKVKTKLEALDVSVALDSATNTCRNGRRLPITIMLLLVLTPGRL